MTQRAAECPGCGAPLRFAWSSAVQTACPYCHAIIVRHDVDLERVGEAADLPSDASPLQIGAEGQFDSKNFLVVGRPIVKARDPRAAAQAILSEISTAL